MTSSKLEQIRQIKQAIHNLTMRCPIGIRSIDDDHDEKLRRLRALLEIIEKRPAQTIKTID